MGRVYKYPLQFLSAAQQISMKRGAKIVHVQLQENRPTLWAIVGPDALDESRIFRLFATGEDVPEWFTYIGTVHLGWAVWHIFEAEKG